MEIKYKTADGEYQLIEPYSIPIDIFPQNDVLLTSTGLRLHRLGVLSIPVGYEWDGATGGIDTDNFMRGSLVHDALYDLLERGAIAKKYRKVADKMLREICIEDGMSKWRAWRSYLYVRAFGGRAWR